ncbi:MAG: NUDIX hydrolase [Pseudanabaena sp. ELA607]|jgi:ADP-ribose pyrophosphatase
MSDSYPSELSVPFELINNRLTHHGKKFSYRVDQIKLPNGITGEYAHVRHPGAAIAVPVTEAGTFILVRQYRFAVGRYLLEFPAGTLEPNEEPDLTIRRELEEETGYSASRWQDLGAFYLCPGYSSEIIYAYLAQDLTKLEHPPAQDDDEEIEVIEMSRMELEACIHSQQVATLVDAKSVTAFYLALPYL